AVRRQPRAHTGLWGQRAGPAPSGATIFVGGNPALKPAPKVETGLVIRRSEGSQEGLPGFPPRAAVNLPPGFVGSFEGSPAGGESYARLNEGPLIRARGKHALSTFSIDVDTASYAN